MAQVRLKLWHVIAGLIGAGALARIVYKISARDKLRLAELREPFKSKAEKILREAQALGTPVYITEAYRTPERQEELYSQGRYGPRAGMPIVTNTRASTHQTRSAVDLWPVGVGFDAEGSKKAQKILAALVPFANSIGVRNLGTSRLGDWGHFEDEALT